MERTRAHCRRIFWFMRLADSGCAAMGRRPRRTFGLGCADLVRRARGDGDNAEYAGPYSLVLEIRGKPCGGMAMAPRARDSRSRLYVCPLFFRQPVGTCCGAFCSVSDGRGCCGRTSLFRSADLRVLLKSLCVVDSLRWRPITGV